MSQSEIRCALVLGGFEKKASTRNSYAMKTFFSLYCILAGAWMLISGDYSVSNAFDDVKGRLRFPLRRRQVKTTKARRWLAVALIGLGILSAWLVD